MQRSKLHCKLYHTKNGDTRFAEEVVRPIMQDHRSKKKLIRMLESEFIGENGSTE